MGDFDIETIFTIPWNLHRMIKLLFVTFLYSLFVIPTAVGTSTKKSNVGNSTKKATIHIAGLFPLSHDQPEGAIGRGVLPAVQLALDHVNNNTDILKGYQLEMEWNDTKVRSTFPV